MKIISSSVEDAINNEMLQTSLELFFYFKVPLPIYSVSNGIVVLVGNATGIISVGDFCLVSLKSYKNEYEVTNISYLSGYTTLTLYSSANSLVFTSPPYELFNLFVFVRRNLTEDLIRSSLSKISDSFDGSSLSEFTVGDVYFNLFNTDNSLFDLSSTRKTGLFLKESCKVTLYSVGSNYIEFTTADFDIDLPLLCGAKVQILSGTARGMLYISMQAEYNGIYTRLYFYTDRYDPYTDGIESGVSAKISFATEGVLHLRMRVKATSPSEEDWIPYLFYVRLENIDINTYENFVRIHGLSLLTELDREKAYQFSEEGAFLNLIPGIKILHYSKGALAIYNYGIKKINYSFPAYKAISGIEIQSISASASKGIYLLRFRYPNYFQFGGGEWVQKERDSISDDTDYLKLTASDGVIITCQFVPLDYPGVSLEDLIYVDLDEQFNLAVSQGLPVIQIDSGSKVAVPVLFTQISNALSNGPDPANDLMPQYGVSELTLLNPATETFFLGLHSKFLGFYLEGVSSYRGASRSPGTPLNLQYAISSFDNSWLDITSSISIDTTEGLSHDGYILWDIVQNWMLRTIHFSAFDPNTYMIRVTKSDYLATVKAFRIIPVYYCQGAFGDVYYFTCFYNQVVPGELSDDIILHQDTSTFVKSTVVSSWKSNYRLIDLISGLVDLTAFYDSSNLPTEKVFFPDSDYGLNLLAKIPRYYYPKKTINFSLSPSSERFLYFSVQNEIWRFSEITNFELIYSVPENYYIYNFSFNASTKNLIVFCLRAVSPENTLDYSKTFDKSLSLIYVITGYDLNPVTSIRNISLSEIYFLYPEVIFRHSLNEENTSQNHPEDNIYIHVGKRMSFSEVITIPFPQSLVAIRYNTNWADDENPINVGISSYWKSGDFGVGTASIPTRIDTGFVIYNSNPLHADVGVEDFAKIRYSLGAKNYFEVKSANGILVQVQYSSAANECRSSVELIRYVGTSITRTKISPKLGCSLHIHMIDENLAFLTPLFQDLELPTSSDVLRHVSFNQTSWLLSSAEGIVWPGASFKELFLSMYTDLPYQTFQYQGNTISKPNMNYLEMFVPDEASGIDGEVWRESGGSWTNVTGTSFNINPYDSVVVCNLNSRFSRVVFKGPDLEANLFQSAWVDRGDDFVWDSVSLPDRFENYMVGENLIYTNSLFVRWEKLPAGRGAPYYPPGMSSGYAVRFNNSLHTKGLFGVEIHSYEIWNSNYLFNLQVAEVSRKAYAILSMVYDSSRDRLYGCVLDRASLQYYLFYIPLSSCRSGTPDTDLMTIINVDIDYDMQYEDFVFDTIHNKVFFVATDKRYQEKSCILYSITGTTVKLETYLVPGMWESRNVEFSSTGTGALFGVVGNKYSYYLWHYANSSYIRILLADFGDRSIRTALSELSILQLFYMHVSSDGILSIDSRDYFVEVNYEDQPVMTSKDITKMSIIEDYKHNYDCVVIKYSSEFGSSEVSIGNPLSDKVLSINNGFIRDKFLAKFVCEELMDLFCYYVKELSIDTKFFIQYEIFDFLRIRAKNEVFPFDDTKLWIIMGLDINFNTSSITFKIIDKGK